MLKYNHVLGGFALFFPHLCDHLVATIHIMHEFVNSNATVATQFESVKAVNEETRGGEASTDDNERGGHLPCCQGAMKQTRTRQGQVRARKRASTTGKEKERTI